MSKFASKANLRKINLYASGCVAVVAANLLITQNAMAQTRAPAKQDCAAIARAALPQATIKLAKDVPAGDFLAPAETNGAGAPQLIQNLPAFCRVWAVARPTADSEINFEVWMPTAGWNGKFMGVGNGVWRGSLSFPAMAQMLTRGYAVASTDTGHLGPSGDASFALGHPEKLIDFGHRGVHTMTVLSKSLVNTYYGQAAKYSYWNGCSSGGKQGLKEAQFYPEDYDGIIAGAPANRWTHLLTWENYLAQAVARDLRNFIPADKYSLINRAVLALCDEIDGVKDGLIDDPRRCNFRAADLKIECRDGATENCLTTNQLGLLDIAYAPMRDRSGKVIFPRLQPGTELGFQGLLGRAPFETSVSYYKYVVHENPNWSVLDFNLERDLPIAVAKDRAGGRLDAYDPDLRPFNARGGKILMYMGWSDQLIAPELSTDYYESVQNEMGPSVTNFFRLFMVPGMLHCQGGSGPDQFDKVRIIEDWVERGIAPERIEAVQRGTTATQGQVAINVTRSRPLCVYPAVAKYRGQGSIDDSANFECRKS